MTYISGFQSVHLPHPSPCATSSICITVEFLRTANSGASLQISWIRNCLRPSIPDAFLNLRTTDLQKWRCCLRWGVYQLYHQKARKFSIESSLLNDRENSSLKKNIKWSSKNRQCMTVWKPQEAKEQRLRSGVRGPAVAVLLYIQQIVVRKQKSKRTNRKKNPSA